MVSNKDNSDAVPNRRSMRLRDAPRQDYKDIVMRGRDAIEEFKVRKVVSNSPGASSPNSSGRRSSLKGSPSASGGEKGSKGQRRGGRKTRQERESSFEENGETSSQSSESEQKIDHSDIHPSSSPPATKQYFTLSSEQTCEPNELHKGSPSNVKQYFTGPNEIASSESTDVKSEGTGNKAVKYKPIDVPKVPADPQPVGAGSIHAMEAEISMEHPPAMKLGISRAQNSVDEIVTARGGTRFKAKESVGHRGGDNAQGDNSFENSIENHAGSLSSKPVHDKDALVNDLRKEMTPSPPFTREALSPREEQKTKATASMISKIPPGKCKSDEKLSSSSKSRPKHGRDSQKGTNHSEGHVEGKYVSKNKEDRNHSQTSHSKTQKKEYNQRSTDISKPQKTEVSHDRSQRSHDKRYATSSEQEPSLKGSPTASTSEKASMGKSHSGRRIKQETDVPSALVHEVQSSDDLDHVMEVEVRGNTEMRDRSQGDPDIPCDTGGTRIDGASAMEVEVSLELPSSPTMISANVDAQFPKDETRRLGKDDMSESRAFKNPVSSQPRHDENGLVSANVPEQAEISAPNPCNDSKKPMNLPLSGKLPNISCHLKHRVGDKTCVCQMSDVKQGMNSADEIGCKDKSKFPAADVMNASESVDMKEQMNDDELKLGPDESDLHSLQPKHESTIDTSEKTIEFETMPTSISDIHSNKELRNETDIVSGSRSSDKHKSNAEHHSRTRQSRDLRKETKPSDNPKERQFGSKDKNVNERRSRSESSQSRMHKEEHRHRKEDDQDRRRRSDASHERTEKRHSSHTSHRERKREESHHRKESVEKKDEVVETKSPQKVQDSKGDRKAPEASRKGKTFDDTSDIKTRSRESGTTRDEGKPVKSSDKDRNENKSSRALSEETSSRDRRDSEVRRSSRKLAALKVLKEKDQCEEHAEKVQASLKVVEKMEGEKSTKYEDTTTEEGLQSQPQLEFSSNPNSHQTKAPSETQESDIHDLQQNLEHLKTADDGNSLTQASKEGSGEDISIDVPEDEIPKMSVWPPPAMCFKRPKSPSDSQDTDENDQPYPEKEPSKQSSIPFKKRHYPVEEVQDSEDSMTFESSKAEEMEFEDGNGAWKDPIPYINLEENIYQMPMKRSKDTRRMLCDCVLPPGGLEGCGEECLNRLLLIECGPRCRLGNLCANKNFQQKNYQKVELFYSPKKGHGLKAGQDMESGAFIMEYVGEVIDYEQLEKRLHVNLQWTVNGELRIGFFCIKDIPAGEEITFNYNFQIYGGQAQKCYCGASNCTGFIGNEVDSDEESEESNDRTLEELDDSLEEELEYLCETGLRSTEHTQTLCRLMAKVKEAKPRLTLLRLVQNGDSAHHKAFLRFHGLNFIRSWMTELSLANSDPDVCELRREILATLSILPVPHKTMLINSKILPAVEAWTESRSCSSQEVSGQNKENEAMDLSVEGVTKSDASLTLSDPQLPVLAKELLSVWSGLKELYRIPKRKSQSEEESSLSRVPFLLSQLQKGTLPLYQGRRQVPIPVLRARPREPLLRPKRSEKDPYEGLSKEDRRRLFEQQVAEEDERRRREAEEERKRQEEAEEQLRQFGIDPQLWPYIQAYLPQFYASPDGGFYASLPDGTTYQGEAAIALYESMSGTPTTHTPSPHLSNASPSAPQIPFDLPPKWVAATDPSGRVYYYHMRKRVPQWLPPLMADDPDSSSDSSSSGDSDEDDSSSEDSDDEDTSSASSDEDNSQGSQPSSTENEVPVADGSEVTPGDVPLPPNGREAPVAEMCSLSKEAQQRLKRRQKRLETGLVTEHAISPRNEEEDREAFKELMKSVKRRKERLLRRRLTDDPSVFKRPRYSDPEYAQGDVLSSSDEDDEDEDDSSPNTMDESSLVPANPIGKRSFHKGSGGDLGGKGKGNRTLREMAGHSRRRTNIPSTHWDGTTYEGEAAIALSPLRPSSKVGGPLSALGDPLPHVAVEVTRPEVMRPQLPPTFESADGESEEAKYSVGLLFTNS
ncbi:unnamed protein product, partial [Darwinula stevensoni]